MMKLDWKLGILGLACCLCLVGTVQADAPQTAAISVVGTDGQPITDATVLYRDAVGDWQAALSRDGVSWINDAPQKLALDVDGTLVETTLNFNNAVVTVILGDGGARVLLSQAANNAVGLAPARPSESEASAGGGGCCIANGSPGCDDDDCEALVCAADSFCCDVSWDGICAGEACSLGGSGGGCVCGCCAGCGPPPPPGSCGACDSGGVCDSQVGINGGFIQTCNDGLWVSLAFPVNTGGGTFNAVRATHHTNTGVGDLYIMGGTCAGPDVNDIRATGCGVIVGQPADVEVEYCLTDFETDADNPTWVVMVFDSGFSFDVKFNSGTLGTSGSAYGNLDGGGDPSLWQDLNGFGFGACYCVDITTSECTPAECGNNVQEPGEQCDGTDDAACPGECSATCTCPVTGPCGPGAGDCFIANGTPGCDDVECCQAVCAIDGFCCDVSWDSICAGEALDLCGDFVCGDGTCDPTEDCASCEADCGACPEICGAGAGNCCASNGTPGCECVPCCECICGCDPFCCDTSWDSLCAGQGVDGICGASNPAGPCASVCPCLGGSCGGIPPCESNADCDAGEVCIDGECVPEPTGQCCYCGADATGTCTVATEAECEALGGEYGGNGSNCSVAGETVEVDASPNLAIPDNGPPVCHTINMGMDFTLVDITVDVNINHTWIGDLCVTLAHNGGTPLTLIQRPDSGGALDCNGGCCGCSADNFNVTLDDAAAQAFDFQCVNNLTGTYSPDNSLLAAFSGGSSAGTWTICVDDNAGADTGTLVSWGLNLTGEATGAGPCDDLICISEGACRVCGGCRAAGTLTTECLITENADACAAIGGIFQGPGSTSCTGECAECNDNGDCDGGICLDGVCVGGPPCSGGGTGDGDDDDDDDRGGPPSDGDGDDDDGGSGRGNGSDD